MKSGKPLPHLQSVYNVGNTNLNAGIGLDLLHTPYNPFGWQGLDQCLGHSMRQAWALLRLDTQAGGIIPLHQPSPILIQIKQQITCGKFFSRYIVFHLLQHVQRFRNCKMRNSRFRLNQSWNERLLQFHSISRIFYVRELWSCGYYYVHLSRKKKGANHLKSCKTFFKPVLDKVKPWVKWRNSTTCKLLM